MALRPSVLHPQQVREGALPGTSADAETAALARAEGRALVTENIADFAHEEDWSAC